MHALRPAKKSRAIYHVRPSVDDRPEQDTIITRVVFQVCILHQHDLSGCLRKPASQRRSLALVRCLKEEPQIPQLDLVASILCRREFISICLPRRHVLQNLPRSVRRAIIHDDHFLAHFGVQHSPQDLIDCRFLVVNGNHDRDFRIVQRGGVSSLMGHKCSKIVAAQPPRSKDNFGQTLFLVGLGCYPSFRPPAESAILVGAQHAAPFVEFAQRTLRCLASSSNNSVAAPRKPMAPPSSANCSTAAAPLPPRPPLPTSSSSTPAPSPPLPTPRPATPSENFMPPTLPSASSSPAAMPSELPKNWPRFPASPGS